MPAQQRIGRLKARCTRRHSIARLRSAFFAQAGESAARYGISFERVLLHLWEGRRVSGRFQLRHVAHLEDLVHAVACVDDRSLAWADLADQYERALIRSCRGMKDEIDATILIRRLLADLRRGTMIQDFGRGGSLRGYLGTRTLRSWLTERLHALRSLHRLDVSWRSGEMRTLRDGTFDLAQPVHSGSSEPLQFCGSGQAVQNPRAEF